MLSRKRLWVALYALTFILLLNSCVDPFDPQVKNTPESFLVVDGFINSQGITTIKLSRTVNLSADSIAPPETQATVYIEAEAGSSYNLAEQDAGTYTSGSLSLDLAKKYRLHIQLISGKEYISDYTSIKITPPIDNINWEAKNNGLQIYVNSHDATNSTQYYRWQYEETWEFNAAFYSGLEYSNNTIISRTEDIYLCWKTELSSAIRIASTVRLNQDVVSNYPLVNLPTTSAKLARRYSILVKQYALSPEEHLYYETLQKNTENIGSLFDPLPTQLTGNIHAVANASEPVIGFVGAYSETQKRIFVGREELPKDWGRTITGYESCPVPDSIVIDGLQYRNLKEVEDYFRSTLYLPLSPIYSKGMPVLIGYTASSASCADCRLRGTNVKPDFWE
ncbi:DUF4249 domain-containing protein [Adhaeribacter pallidiroseus]|uniref:DUF4249 domain-containing protein n=1 Tax=Adhaeribacter pallidiroseus TaxID=2072847 RepID=A0A369QJN2_9BACT|nr:DUF4249 domain-containing protein [Adhaeribacter pallidiroseus]RDC65121.1 hypothetical protein AHMF7616_03751 [Adhaeribacter pallidiroseus]